MKISQPRSGWYPRELKSVLKRRWNFQPRTRGNTRKGSFYRAALSAVLSTVVLKEAEAAAAMEDAAMEDAGKVETPAYQPEAL
jgi:hypothetical protein